LLVGSVLLSSTNSPIYWTYRSIAGVVIRWCFFTHTRTAYWGGEGSNRTVPTIPIGYRIRLLVWFTIPIIYARRYLDSCKILAFTYLYRFLHSADSKHSLEYLKVYRTTYRPKYWPYRLQTPRKLWWLVWYHLSACARYWYWKVKLGTRSFRADYFDSIWVNRFVERGRQEPKCRLDGIVFKPDIKYDHIDWDYEYTNLYLVRVWLFWIYYWGLLDAMYIVLIYNHAKCMSMLPLLPYNHAIWEDNSLRYALMIALAGRIVLATPHMRLVSRSRNEPNIRYRFGIVSDFFSSSGARHFIWLIDSLPRRLLQLWLSIWLFFEWAPTIITTCLPALHLSASVLAGLIIYILNLITWSR
jgi:hypothetical protein